MKKFGQHFQNELNYLRALQKRAAQENPHLDDILSGQDPDVERLNEGFAALMARLGQKVNDANPEVTLPLLQRLHSQPIKGLPATSVIQLNGDTAVDFACSLPTGTKVFSETGATFITSRPCDIEPLALIRREISHQAQETHLTLTFEYTGKEEYWEIKPISLFLSPDETLADTLMFSLLQRCTDIVFHQDGFPYPMGRIELEPLSGMEQLVLSPPQKHGNWALQMLMEALYLPHVHHFLRLVLPTYTRDRLAMKTAREFTITLKLDGELDVSAEQMADAFQLHCVPVANRQLMPLTVPFVPDTACYRLPLPPEKGLLEVINIELEQEPGDGQERGHEYRFYPDRFLNGMNRYAEEEHVWFYSLAASEDALGRLQCDLTFRDSQSRLMAQPPARKFICHIMGFEFLTTPLAPGEICYAEEALPDQYQVRNLTPTSSCFPPITDSPHYWTLLSHYSSSAFLLYSPDALKDFLLGHDFYADTDRNVSRTLRRRIAGIVAINSVAGDRIIKGSPHRCMFVDLVLDKTVYTHDGEMFRFANTVLRFLPFCLTQNIYMLMTCSTTSGESYAVSGRPVQGYRPLM
ncbi:type VI secretion system protein VasA [Xenorhabdus beddingii]|uniref:Type VI secretion system protein VasA n=1 Tax=Xenorhabdus beddingii TaxID=40578 RepID=A0A1Y2SM11_9GAMM|nr:type VI secretion system baseplate subunit TssF [Xenorhabdus beddingii]OTA20044.1 type VI secretion system protein VasA [Xenorhabdus beddingii]